MRKKRARPDLRSRSKRLETARVGERVFERLTGRDATIPVALGYRRASSGVGTWYGRWFNAETRKYELFRLADADDVREPDGAEVLSWGQAKAKAELEARQRAAAPIANAEYTVADAIDDYLKHLKADRGERARKNAAYVAERHILPSRLARLKLTKLSRRDISVWRDSIAALPPMHRGGKIAKAFSDLTEDELRARRATANRILTVLKAALNHAKREERVSLDVWSAVRPFPLSGASRDAYLTVDECERLINACEPGFRLLVRAALHTGARYRELTSMKVGDFDQAAGKLVIRVTKNGHERRARLLEAGVEFFRQLTLGRERDEFMFVRANGTRWNASQQSRPMREACAAARIPKTVSFHTLRHTVASQLAMAGVPMKVIAEVLGHRDSRIAEQHYAHMSDDHIDAVVRAALVNLGGEPEVGKISPIRAAQK